MNCSACGHDNRAGAKFCEDCATPLKRVCANCSVELRPTAKFCDDCGAPVAAKSGDSRATAARGATVPATATESAGARKTVSIVFADLVGSTAMQERLDPESTRRFMERYYAAMRAAVEGFGGTVTQLLGDGVKAVFGIPRVAEDDAIRAVRAAVEMQRTFHELAAQQAAIVGKTGLRVAVNTGEVIAKDASEIIGDPVNVAARLQERGGDGDVVVGEATEQLVATLITLAPLGSFALKGRSEAVVAFRVVSLERPAGAKATVFVGRGDELARIAAIFNAATSAPAARLSVLVGSPGLGKSRLIEEFARRRGETATVISAHCDAAGGATFAPLGDALRVLLLLDDAKEVSDVRAAIEAVVPELEADRTRIVTGVAALIAGTPAPPEETFFVIRRLLTALARARPVVLIIDDLHWAEPLLLDLIEHLVQWGAGVPLLVLVGARPELREVRSSFTTIGGLIADVLTLGGLDAGAAMRLAANVIGADDLPAAVAAKVLSTSEGNPLFVGELVRMLVHEGALRQDGERWTAGTELARLTLPPTIQALLAARMERLRPDDLSVLERAAVIGRVFSRGAIAALLARDRTDIDAHIESLRRSELIESDTGWFLGEPALRFHHALIRDVAYRRVLKGTRAELHARFANWIDAHFPAALEHEETLAWHLENAHQYLGELGPLDGAGRELGERAAQHLASAGRRALQRDDVPLAANLLGRAIERLDADSAARAGLALDWCEALLSAGDVATAALAIDALGRFVDADPRLRAWHTCFTGQLQVLSASQALHGAADAVAGAAQTLTELNDASGEAKAHFVHALVLARLGQGGAGEAALDRALAAARRAGDRRLSNAVLAGAPVAALWGPSPVTRASGRCLDVVRVLRITQGSAAVESVALGCQGVLEALRGRVDAARRMVASSRKLVEELGIGHRLLEADVFMGRIDLIEGDAGAAEASLRPALARLRDLGLSVDAARVAALLARALLLQGRVDEAEALSHESEALAGDDLQAGIAWRAIRAEGCARLNRHDEGVALAQSAVAIAGATDNLLDHADARMALAFALRAAGREAESAHEMRAAIELWEVKGATLLVEHARRADERLASAGPKPHPAQTAVSRAPIARNAATQAVARAEQGFAMGDFDAIAAQFSDSYVEVDHPTGSRYGREAAVASVRRLHRSHQAVLRYQPMGVLGESLALTWRRSAAAGASNATFDVGAYDNRAAQIYRTDAHGQFSESEVFTPANLGNAVMRLYERYAAQHEAGSAKARAETIHQSISVLTTQPPNLAREQAPWSADVALIDRRTRGAGELHGDAAINELHRATFDRERSTIRIDDVLGLDHDKLLFMATMSGPARVDDDEFERQWLNLLEFNAAGRVARYWRFDADDAARALAAFESVSANAVPREAARQQDRAQAHAPGAAPGVTDSASVTPFANAALQVIAAALSVLRARNWSELRLRLADDFQYDEQRSPNHHTLDRDGYLAFAEAAAERIATEAPMQLLATRGESLCLVRLRFADGSVSPSDVDSLMLVLVDASNMIVGMVQFDVTDIDTAYAALHARFSAGEGAPHIAQCELIDTFVHAVAQRDWQHISARCSADLIEYDHRALAVLGTTHGADAWVNNFRTLAELAPDTVYRCHHFRALARGTWAVGTWVGTRDGGPYEIPLVAVLELGDEGLLIRADLFDEDQNELALARFDELTRGSDEATADHPFANAATRTSRRCYECFNARDWAGIAAIAAPDLVFDERRRLLRNTADRELWLAQMRLLLDVPEGRFTMELRATRGERLCLHVHRFEGMVADGGGPLAIEDHFALHEVTRLGRIVAIVLFDLDDEHAAYTELDARFHARPEHASAARWVEEFGRCFAARDWVGFAALSAADQVAENHRLVGWGTLRGAGAWVQTLTALVELSPDVEWRLAQLRTSPRGILWQSSWRGTRDGGPFETPMLVVCELDAAGRQSRMDVWDVEMIAAARARFDALSAPSTSISLSPSAGSRTPFANKAFANKAFANKATLASDVMLEFMHAIGDVNAANIRADVLATRGESLALTRLRVAAGDADVGQSAIDDLLLIETDASGRTQLIVRWNGDALAVAYDDLDARYGRDASAVPAHRHNRAFRDALCVHDWSALAAICAPGFVEHDRRSLALLGSTRGAEEWTANFRAQVALAPDTTPRFHHIRHNRRGYIAQFSWLGTREGGDYEIPMIVVVELDATEHLMPRCDLFEPEQHEQAFARFDALTRDGALPVPVSTARHEQPTRATAVWSALEPQIRSAVSTGNYNWSALRASCAADMRWEDRRALMQLSGDRDLMIASMRERAATGARLERSHTVGTFGERVAVLSVTWAGGPTDGRFEMAYFVLIEIDAQDQLTCMLLIDADRAVDAQREAQMRWIAIDPAVESSVMLMARLAEAFNAHDTETWRALCTDDIRVDDKRRTGYGRVDGADAFIHSIKALWDLSSNTQADIGWFWPAAGPQGCVTVVRRHGTSNLSVSDHGPDSGGEFESQYLQLWMHANGRITHTEMFELEDQALAIARYEQLAQSQARDSPAIR